jgi:DNA-binding transcriptional LysR family regulator
VSRTSLDLEVLRSFVAGVEMGSFAMAAQHMSRSTSAISAQLKNWKNRLASP